MIHPAAKQKYSVFLKITISLQMEFNITWNAVKVTTEYGMQILVYVLQNATIIL